MTVGENSAPLAHFVAESGIARVAVIGAGVMGAGIAAQFANAGLGVELLDIAGPDGRDAPARAGIARQVKAHGFMGASGPGLVQAGNIEDDLDRLADCDWIVEAIIERRDLKQDLYRRIEAVRKPGSIVSSNTSTIPHADLLAGLPESFARDFVITHFFNPPRVMQLLEVVTSPQTDPAIAAGVVRGGEAVLGKTVIACRDTPGFIANRIGCFWMAAAVIEALRLGLTVEEADAVHGAFGVPRTGIFGLFDLVGIDLVPEVWTSLMGALPTADRLQGFDLPSHPLIQAMIGAGRLGRKSGGGFYRRGETGREALDLATLEYRPHTPVDPATLPGGGRDLAAMLEAQGRLGDYARAVFANVLCYAAENGPEIAGDVGAVDTGMVLGYAWKAGPFALADRLGAVDAAGLVDAELGVTPALMSQAQEAGGFYRQGQALSTAGGCYVPGVAVPALSVARAPVLQTQGASLWDMGEGIACFEVHTKMNSMHPSVFDAMEQALEVGPQRFEGLVIGNNDARAFSVGADLSFILGMTRAGDFATLEAYISRGQQLYLGLKYAPVPVVAAMHGFALGGGCEIGLHADAIVAHAELAAGLPEVKVGLIPAWGGCTQLMARALASGQGPEDAARSSFAVILNGGPTRSAEEARELGFLRPTDRHVMGRNLLLPAAREVALGLVGSGYTPPARIEIARAGPVLIPELVARVADAEGVSPTDIALARTLAGVLCGASAGPVSEEAMMAEERAALIALGQSEATAARMEHMLKTGKPLRN